MTKREKRLAKIKQNPKDVSFDDLKLVLEDYGFELLRSSGSHHSFKIIINGVSHLFVVPYRRPVKVVYVREALDLIEQIQTETADDSEDEDTTDDNGNH